MAADVLAEFRRPGAIAPVRQHAAPVYEAFGLAGSGARSTRLDIRPKAGFAIARTYASITEIHYDQGKYTGIILISGKPLKLRGRNLRPVVEALLAGTCAFLAELPDGETAPDGAPVIRSIEPLKPVEKASPAT